MECHEERDVTYDRGCSRFIVAARSITPLAPDFGIFERFRPISLSFEALWKVEMVSRNVIATFFQFLLRRASRVMGIPEDKACSSPTLLQVLVDESPASYRRLSAPTHTKAVLVKFCNLARLGCHFAKVEAVDATRVA